MRSLRDMARFYWERRWTMAFLSLAAGLFAAPFLYWNSILMRIVMNAAHATDLLLGLNLLHALGGLLLLLLAAWGMGGSLHVLRKELAGADTSLPKDFLAGLRGCAKCSLLAGALLGFSLGVLRVGLVGLHALPCAGAARAALTAALFLQFLLALPLCVLTMCQGDGVQARPLRALMRAGRQLLSGLGRHWLFTLMTIAPFLLFFIWQKPVLTLLGFLLVTLFAIAPVMLLWLRHCEATKLDARKSPVLLKAMSVLLALVLLASSILALALPLTRQGTSPARVVQTSLRETVDFVLRMTMQDADNGALRDLLSDTSTWAMLAVGLLGSACCVAAAYFCACYRFRRRHLLFGCIALLQLLPLTASFSYTDQLLRNLHLPERPVLLGAAWALLYLCAAALLYRRLHQVTGEGIQEGGEPDESIWRVFFYRVLPKVRLHVIAIAALVSFGCWNNALAPFWYMQKLGAFSVSEYIWEHTVARERAAYVIVLAGAMLAALLLAGLTTQRKRLSK